MYLHEMMEVPTEKKQRGKKLPLHWLGDVSAASTSIPSCATRARLAGVVSALWRLTERDWMLSLARKCFFMQMRIKKADGKWRRMEMGYKMLHWKEPM